MEELVSKLSPKAQHDYKLVRRAVDNGDQGAYAELHRMQFSKQTVTNEVPQ